MRTSRPASVGQSGKEGSPRAGRRPASGRRAGILIAHRLRAVQRADVIAVLEDEQLIEYGPREQLARDPTSRCSPLLRAGHDMRMDRPSAPAD